MAQKVKESVYNAGTCMLSHFSHVWLFVIPWTVAHQAPLSMEFSRQEYWSGLPFPSPGDLPDPDGTRVSCIAGGFFTTWATTEARYAGDLGSVPGSGRSPGEGNGSPLQYSCLENSMDRGAWWATVHGVSKNQTRLSHSHFHCLKYKSSWITECRDQDRMGWGSLSEEMMFKWNWKLRRN